ncbi:unnamed protein product [Bursaphelenchus xylophilus]|uniref:(pine wood nematode) hypothetical protein n=1 Tax=Bursaphelenchus xylophilus TaxID=6326 RepID=A0A1I7SD96_BURXY|nr:unnamed protein product [Bursaphelenchus xylophilus]CAG9130550.1 unnamed protein product [Bursaphelenchus xylophilus]
MSGVRQGFTCVTCRLVFPNSTLQKEHYVSEWHRYNAKRNVVGLPPITEEQFESKVAEEQKKEEIEKNYCKYCKKLFQSKNSYDNHLQSKRHKTNFENYAMPSEEKFTKEIPAPSETISVDSTRKFVDGEDLDDCESSGGWETASSEDEYEYDEDKAIPNSRCLFCPKESGSVEDNLSHMYESHGFFVPDAQYCTDVSGLMKYLGLKVGGGLYCIKCSKRFSDLHSVQLHMKDKVHLSFSLDDDLVNYLDFYDYGELLGEGDDDGDDVALDLGYTLVLPSGAKLGHRSLMKYFKQRLRSDEEQKRLANARIAMKSKVEQKSLGWTGLSGPVAIQRARDFKFVRRVMQKQWLSKGMHSNKLFKTRGRDDQM